MQKKIQAFLFFAFMAVFAPYGNIANAETLIPDSALESAIRNTLGKPTGEITSAEMESLTSLDAEELNITDLSGLETAVNLKRLRLRRNQISDISALSGLTRLVYPIALQQPDHGRQRPERAHQPDRARALQQPDQ